MSALSFALRQSACQSERNGSAPHAEGVKGYRGAVACSQRAARMQLGVLLAPAARPPAAAPPRSTRSRRPKGSPAPSQRTPAAPCSSPYLLDAVGALERLRGVPRLQQQHRVPDGTDAVAE
eukprot:scaffold28220_cov74-Phaeocystis_antarctica.AAC.3